MHQIRIYVPHVSLAQSISAHRATDTNLSICSGGVANMLHTTLDFQGSDNAPCVLLSEVGMAICGLRNLSLGA
eukprot:1138133-Pelagomonas_calceolata.AAC.2